MTDPQIIKKEIALEPSNNAKTKEIELNTAKEYKQSA